MDDLEKDFIAASEYKENPEDAYSGGRLFGVALAGALLSLGAYYVYQQLDPDRKAKLKKQASGMIAEQIHTLTDLSED